MLLLKNKIENRNVCEQFSSLWCMEISKSENELCQISYKLGEGEDKNCE